MGFGSRAGSAVPPPPSKLASRTLATCEGPNACREEYSRTVHCGRLPCIRPCTVFLDRRENFERDGVAISASGSQAYVVACMNFTPLPVTSRGIDMFFGFQQHSVAYFCVASSEATRQQTRLSGVCTLFRVSVIPVFYPGGYRVIQKAHTTVPCAHECSGQGHQQQPPRKTQCRSQMLLNRFCLDEE